MATILVTRPERDAERTAKRLRADGHEAILSPALAIQPVDAPPPIAPVDAILVASANVAHWLGRADIRSVLADRPVFAVGDHAAESIRSLGYGDVRSAAGAAGDLIDLVARDASAPARLLAPVGRTHGDEIIDGLRARGFDVEPIIVYDAQPVAQLSPEAIAGLRYDVITAVLHYSTRSAARLIELADQAGAREALARPIHVCLSREILESLPEDLRARAISAESPNEDSLFIALSRALGASPAAEIMSSDESAARGKRTPRQRAPRVIDGEAKRVVDAAPEPAAASSPPVAEATAPQAFSTAKDAASSGMEAASDARAFDGDPDLSKETPASSTHANDAPKPGEASSIAAENNSPRPAAPAQPSSPPQSQFDRREAARTRPAIMTPFLVGGFAGAAAGAAISFWAQSALSPPRQPSLDVGALDARFSALAPRADLAAAQQKVDGVAAALARENAALRNDIAALAKRIDGLSTSAAPPNEGAVDSDLKAAVAAQAQIAQSLSERLKSLDARIDEIARASARISAPATDIANAIRRHALAGAVVQSLARSGAYANELDALKSLGASAEQIAALQIFAGGGAPSARALSDSFKPLATTLLQQASAIDPSASIATRMTAALKQLVRVRPVGDVAGDDVASLVARIEASLARESFVDALAAYRKLPEPQRGVAADWGRRLQQRADAAQAAQSLLDEAARALSAPAK